MAFRFMLVTADSEPVDPAVFMCAEPRWSVGDVFTLGRDRRYRILDVQPPTTEAAMEDFTAVWTVEKIADPLGNRERPASSRPRLQPPQQ